MVAILLMVLFQRFWRWLTVISRTKRLMMDVSSSAGEVVMLGAGSIEHRELVYYNIQKSTTFEPPRAGPRLVSYSRIHCRVDCTLHPPRLAWNHALEPSGGPSLYAYVFNR